MKKLIILLLLCHCSTYGNGTPVQPHPTAEVTDTEYCAEAESHLQSLCNANPSKNQYCCSVVAATKKGKSFTAFCQETQSNSIFLNPKCITNIGACSDIDICTGTSAAN